MAHIIGVTGMSGGGKTSFCQKLCDLLTKEYDVCFISTDWFYKTLLPTQQVEKYNFDTPMAFDFQPLIEALRGHQQVSLPDYDYITHQSLPNQHLYRPDADFVIIEGIMLYHNEQLRQLIDTKIFVHTDLDACLARRILRDLKERGHTIQGVINQWFESVRPGYEEFIYPTMQYADYIFNNTKDNIDQNIRKDLQLKCLLDQLKASRVMHQGH